MPSSRPSRLNARISSFTQRERAALGEQMTIWQADLAQRFVDDGAEIGRAREFLAVPEDRREPLRYRSTRGDRADELLRRPIGLERSMQPLPHFASRWL